MPDQLDVAQIIDALQRAERRLQSEAEALGAALDYGAEFPAEDAERMREAVALLQALQECENTPESSPVACQTPTLEDDTFVDPAIAGCSLALWPRKDGLMTNAVQLLVRPLDVRGDESGGHPGESFVMVTITREEVQVMLAELEQDMADCLQAAGSGGSKQ